MDRDCWLDCRPRFVGEIALKTECCPEPDCGNTDCSSMLKTARLAYKNALENMGKPSQVSADGRSLGNYRTAQDLKPLLDEIHRWEAQCPDDDLTCGCLNGCIKCAPKRRHGRPMTINYPRRH